MLVTGLAVGILVGILVCAIQAIRENSLLHAVLWLACTSALLAVFLYNLGAREIAVMELSIGGGLVTVLIIFALNLVGETTREHYSRRYTGFSLGLVFVAIILLGSFIFPLNTSILNAPNRITPILVPVSVTANSLTPSSFTRVMWEQRGLDTLLQLQLIFSGALGILSLVLEKQYSIGHGITIRPLTVKPLSIQAPENCEPVSIIESTVAPIILQPEPAETTEVLLKPCSEEEEAYDVTLSS